jgi:fumarate reductase subunit C
MSRQPYVRPVSKTTWYMRNGRYKKYMLREVTCLLVAIYCFISIAGLAALADSPGRWAEFIAEFTGPGWVAFHTFSLIFYLIFMTFDWFKLAPKAMPVQLGEKKLEDRFIVIGHYVAWIVVTGVIFWFTGVI